MTSSRPYLIRAIYDWIVDNDMTPHIQVDANYPGAQVPQEYVQEGMIVLNASPTAVVGLDMGNNEIIFSARFQGVEQLIHFPPEAVLAVFARENGQGMPFPPEPYPEIDDESGDKKPGLQAVSKSSTDNSEDKPKTSSAKKRPTLSVVK